MRGEEKRRRVEKRTERGERRFHLRGGVLNGVVNERKDEPSMKALKKEEQNDGPYVE